MAVVHTTTNPSGHRTLQIALPVGAYCADFPQKPEPINATDLVRELIAHAGVLPDEPGDGCRFLLLSLPPHLLQALSAFVPPPPQPMPLLEWRA